MKSSKLQKLLKTKREQQNVQVVQEVVAPIVTPEVQEVKQESTITKPTLNKKKKDESLTE